MRLMGTVILSLLFAVGCGQKGPLYLPGDPSAVKTDIPAQPAGEQESNEEEDDT
jgi:predicted small lipoprotein YifL